MESNRNENHEKYFQYSHLPDGKLQDVNRRFYCLLTELNETTLESAEKSAGVRKLLEAKDCFVRANLQLKG